MCFGIRIIFYSICIGFFCIFSEESNATRTEISQNATSNVVEELPNEQNPPLTDNQNTSLASKSIDSVCSSHNQELASSSNNAGFVLDDEIKKYIEIFHVKQGKQTFRFVRCKACISNQNVVKMFCENRRIPPITTEAGTRYRTASLEEHLKSKYHVECKKALMLTDTSISQSSGVMDLHLNQANKNLANHVGKLFLQVYNDAKKLTLSAYSWPSRYVVTEAGNQFRFEEENKPTIPKNINLQYVNPNGHFNLLNTIVQTDGALKNVLNSMIACSIRIDGSVDHCQIDKIYIMLKVIMNDGRKLLLFLGIGEQTETGAVGLMNAVKNGIIKNLGVDGYKAVMKLVSSICTDGTNINSGDKGGLWKLFEDSIRELGSDLPLLKIWCSAHRLDLVWSDVSSMHKTIKNMLSMVSSIASFFHNSSNRMNELKQIAASKTLPLLSLPKLFEIRWTAYTFTGVNNTLFSWQALVAYFTKNKEKSCQSSGYLNFLTKEKNVRSLCFLADVLLIFHRYHKKLQSDDLTIISLASNLKMLEKALINLRESNLIGGWEEALNNQLINQDGELFLHGIQLSQMNNSRTQRTIDFDNFRETVISSLIMNMEKRFHVEEDMVNVIEPFINFRENANLRKIHEIFGGDLDLSSLVLEFYEIIELKDELGLETTLSQTIGTLLRNEHLRSQFKNIIIVLSRMEICTPHSADVERCISSDNLLKSPLRNRMSVDTETKYLYIYHNMPDIENWNPRHAIIAFLNEKNRRERTDLMQGKAVEANYFKGVFSSAGKINMIDDDTEGESMIKKKTF